MKRWGLFTLALTLVSGLAFGQAAVTSSGQATTAGIAVPVAPVISPPLVVTPIVRLQEASTLPGWQGAAPGATTPPSIRANVEYSPSAVYIGAPPAGATPPAVAAAPSSTATSPVVNLGVNSQAAQAQSNGLHGRSLGEIARALRQKMSTQNARVYTNADIQNAGNSGGVTGTATSVPPTQLPPNASYPVANNGVIMQNGHPMAANSAAIAAPENPNNQTAAPAAPATEQSQQPVRPQTQQPEPLTPPAQAQPQPAAPAAAPVPPQKPSAGAATPQPPQETAEAQLPPNPATQNSAVEQAPAEREQRTPQKTLPKSGSLLPLMALLGAGATVVGLLARK